MASTDLTTLANLKAWIPGLGTGTTPDDATLSRLITAVSLQIATYLSRPILQSQSYTDTYDGKDTTALPLANFPVTAVSSVTVDGFSIPAASPPTPSAPQLGFTFTPTMLELVGGGWPFGPFYRFTRGYQNIVVAYTAGYTAGGNDLLVLEQACIEQCAVRYSERTRIGQKSKSLAGEVVSYFSGDLTPSVKLMLAPYRRVVPR